MERHTLRIKDGSVTVKVEGVKGRSCQDATRKIEEALGKVTSDNPTEEMYERETETQSL
jgi:hypothetical protein